MKFKKSQRRKGRWGWGISIVAGMTRRRPLRRAQMKKTRYTLHIVGKEGGGTWK
jgi:hypothetical protein